jgi:hypothetical protein
VVVDGDVDVLVADRTPGLSGSVGDDRVAVLAAAAHAPAGAADDPADLLDVDVDQLAGPRALVADSWLEAEPAQPADAQARQNPYELVRGS